MKTSQIISLGVALILTLQAATAERSCNCGLGVGTSVCGGGGGGGGSGGIGSGSGDFVVKAAKPVRPAHFASPLAINEASAAKAALGGPEGCNDISSSGGKSRGLDGGLSAQQLMTLGSGARVAPRFSPIGDLCGLNSGSPRSSAAVIPALAPRPRCNVCGLVDSSRGIDGSSGTGRGLDGISLSGGVCAECEARLAAAEAAASSAIAAGGYEGALSRSLATTSRHFNSLGSNYNNLNAFDQEDDGMSFDEQESIYNGQPVPIAPADAVSLSLAYGLAQRAAKIIPEEKLNFGPNRLPADGRVQPKSIPDVPEERLLNVDKPIVELKAPRNLGGSGGAHGSGACSSDDDLAEQELVEQQRLELEAEAEARSAPAPGAFITYSDLGYAPIGPSNNHFINTVPATSYSGSGSALGSAPGSTLRATPGFPGESESPCGELGPPAPGYRSGSVIYGDNDDAEDGDYEGAASLEQDASSSGEEGDCEQSSMSILARLRAAANKVVTGRHHSHHHHGHHGHSSSLSSSSTCGCQQ